MRSKCLMALILLDPFWVSEFYLFIQFNFPRRKWCFFFEIIFPRISDKFDLLEKVSVLLLVQMNFFDSSQRRLNEAE